MGRNLVFGSRRKTTGSVTRRSSFKCATQNPKPTGDADKILIFTVFAIVVFGLVMIFSSGVALSLNEFGNPYYYFLHQLEYGVLPGLLAWLILQNIYYKTWEKSAIFILLFTFLLLMAVFIPGLGQVHKGAARWLDFGFFYVQPTEVAKLGIIIYLATWLDSRGALIQDLKKGFLPFLALLVLFGLLIINQPDMGTFLMICGIATVVFFLANGNLRHLFSLAIIAVAGVGLMIKAAPYRTARFLVFLNPDLDPQGVGYQINQALLAIGSGGILGNGLGHSRQKFMYLPEPINDSIFAIIIEELGLIAGVLLVLGFLIIAWRGFLIAKRAPDVFGRLMAGGITAWLSFQAFANILAITSLMPLTGIPLTFISYGSSSLITSLAAVGILLNISKYSKEKS